MCVSYENIIILNLHVYSGDTMVWSGGADDARELIIQCAFYEICTQF